MLQLILSIQNAKLETPQKSKVSTIQHPREIKGTLLFFLGERPRRMFTVFFSRPHLIYIFFQVFHFLNDNEKVMVFDRMDDSLTCYAQPHHRRIFYTNKINQTTLDWFRRCFQH